MRYCSAGEITTHRSEAKTVQMEDRSLADTVPTPPGESWIFFLKIPGPGKSWKITLVLESLEIKA